MRLGEPVEVPWWVVLLVWPPVGVVAASLLVPAPWWARVVAAVSSMALVLLLVGGVARVESRNMQSVWVSACYGVWAFFLLIWVAGILAAD